MCVSPEVQQLYVAARSAAGKRIDHRVYLGLDQAALGGAASRSESVTMNYPAKNS
jgi:hypothetical protein